MVICGPFFRRLKVSRPDFSMKESDLREGVTAQLESDILDTGTYGIREKDGKWIFDDSMLRDSGRHLRWNRFEVKRIRLLVRDHGVL